MLTGFVFMQIVPNIFLVVYFLLAVGLEKDMYISRKF